MSLTYTTEIEINAPRSKVIELFDDPENLSRWQKGLVSFEHISGEPGKPGARSRLKYKMGSKEIEMIETVEERNLPDEFSGTYETKGVWNLHKNYFLEKGERTLWRTETEFKSSGFMMKFLTTVMPGMFKKQTRQTMRDFKNFVENEVESES